MRQSFVLTAVRVRYVALQVTDRLRPETRLSALTASVLAATVGLGAVAGALAARVSAHASALKDDLLSALINLGYHRPLAERAVESAVKATPDGDFERNRSVTHRDEVLYAQVLGHLCLEFLDEGTIVG